MYTCKIENSGSEILTLTQNESEYQIINIDGLNPPKAQINRSTVGGLDGAKFNSSKLEERNIVVTLRLNGDVESNRIRLYDFFSTKDWCKFYYKNEHRDVYIEGYVESTEVEFFSNSEIMQISIVCLDPYFKDAQLIIDDISKTIRKFEFPFAIDVDEPIPFSEIEVERVTNVVNASGSESGIEINITCLDNINKIKLMNTTTGQNFTVIHSFLANDVITLITTKSQKSITLNRNGVITNLFPKVVKGSVFFQLNRGDNYFSYLIDDGDKDGSVTILYKHRTIYRGV